MNVKNKIENNIILFISGVVLSTIVSTVAFINWFDARIETKAQGFVIAYPEPEVLDTHGVTLHLKEGDSKVDKRYIASNKCKIGEVRAALINPVTHKKQVGICACAEASPENETGKGWYCFD